jgi:hypothetical protein
MANFKEAIEEYGKTQKPKGEILKKEQIEKRIYKPSTELEEIRPIQISSTETDSFAEAWFHTLSINGYTQKVYCPKHNDGQHCPVCQKNEELLKKQSPNRDEKTIEENKMIYKEAMKYAARKYYILRVIDKGNPKEGPKFYRFGESSPKKKDGVWDKLQPVIKEYINKYNIEPTDTKEGASIIMTCVQKEYAGNSYYEPSNIKMDEPSPLDKSQDKIDLWVNDSIKWKEIFRPSTLPGYGIQKYLEAAIDGTLPKWDKERKQWYDHMGNPIVTQKTEASDEVEHKNISVETNTKSIKGKEKPEEVELSSDWDDLPF